MVNGATVTGRETTVRAYTGEGTGTRFASATTSTVRVPWVVFTPSETTKEMVSVVGPPAPESRRVIEPSLE